MAIAISFLCVGIFLAHAVEGKVSCYVCSWHSPTTYMSTNITDTCSHFNFDPGYSSIVECDIGCEAVSRRKSKNGDVVNFYKNCIPASESTSRMEDRCITTESQMEYVTTCKCTSSLCNSALTGRISQYLILIVAFATLTKIFKNG